MILFEVLKKRSKFEPILKNTWQQIGKDMPYPQIVEDDPEQKLLYFGMFAYAAVYASALAAGMSTSAGHYLARMQIGKYNLEKSTVKIVEGIFSGAESEEEQACADFFLIRLAQITEMVMAGEGDIDPVLLELAQGYQGIAPDQG